MEHEGALYFTVSEASEGLVRFGERERGDGGVDASGCGEWEELVPILAREVCHGDELSLLP